LHIYLLEVTDAEEIYNGGMGGQTFHNDPPTFRIYYGGNLLTATPLYFLSVHVKIRNAG
jgi:hypothetical protein